MDKPLMNKFMSDKITAQKMKFSIKNFSSKCDQNQIFVQWKLLPANIFLFKVNKRNTRNMVWNMFKVYNKDTNVFMVNFEHVWHLFPVFLLLTLNKKMFAGSS